VTSFDYRRGLTPIRLSPEHGHFFVRADITEAFGRAMEAMDRAIWTAQDLLRDSITGVQK
jgi:hypothetical protein